MTNIDDIKLDELILISADPQPNGDNINVMEIKLVKVEFYDYSYAKTIDDVAAMERISFMAERMYPARTYTVKA